VADLCGKEPAEPCAMIHSVAGPMLARGLAVILDMDGVIIDSNPVHREAWRLYNQRFGIETDEAMLQRMYGRRNDDIIRDFFGDDLTPDDITRHGADKERLYREMMAGSIEQALVPGIRQFLEALRGSPVALASNAEPSNVAFLLDSSGLRPYFRAVIDGHQVARPKPHPDIYLFAARTLDVRPPDCIVFEDSFSGMEAARAAKMRLVGVTTTHDHFPDVDFTTDNFLNPELGAWLREQKPLQ
jgi:beta-phosphoglucomutase